MIRDLVSVVYILALALGLGAWSAVKATDALPFYAEMTIGPWKAHPETGASEADPYARAYLARSGVMPLTQAEGLAFTAETDSAGLPLVSDCTYLVEGRTATTRRWSMRTTSTEGREMDDTPDTPTVIPSSGLLRLNDGEFRVRISRRPQPGNWLYPGNQPAFAINLALYDTPITSSTALTEVTMPEIRRLVCGDG